jgi:hypothetical protein
VNYWEPNLFENTDYSPVAANNNAEPARAVA